MYNHLAETGADPLIPRDAFNRHPRTTTNFAQIPLRPASKNIFRLLFLSIIFLTRLRPNSYQHFAQDFALSSRIFPLPYISILEEGPSGQLSLSNGQKRNDMIPIPFIPFSVYNIFLTRGARSKGTKKPRSLILAQKDSIVRKPKMPETFG